MMNAVWRLVRRAFRLTAFRADVDADVRDEVDLYLELRTRELEASGMSGDEARRAAEAAFGDRERFEQEARRYAEARTQRRRRREMLASIWGDLSYALRTFRRNPGFTAVAVVTLALGLGANTAIFSVADATLRQAPAVQDPEDLVAVYTTCRRGEPRCASSYPDVLDYRERANTLSDLAWYDHQQVSLGDEAGATVHHAMLVSGNFFDLLGLRPSAGRLIRPSDDVRGGASRVVVLDHAFWADRFGGDRDIVGGTIRLNGAAYTVVGIIPSDFKGLQLDGRPDLWVPMFSWPALGGDDAIFDERQARWMGGVVGRMADGATVERVQEEMLAVSAGLAEEDPAARGPRSITVDPAGRYLLPTTTRGDIVRLVRILLGVVGFTLLLACANLANLLLARATARQGEIAVRVAIGAERMRIVRQLLTESILLAGLGGIVGLAVAQGLFRLLSGFRLPGGVALSALPLGLDGTVFAFTAALAMGCGLLFGCLPAFQATRRDVMTGLRGQAAGSGPGTGRLRGFLVALQVALSLLLLVGSGLFLRTLSESLAFDIGFRPRGLAVASFEPALAGYGPEDAVPLLDELRARIASRPGVTSVSVGRRIPMAPGGLGTFVTVDGYQPGPDEEMRVEYNVVAPDYFRTLGLPVLSGREPRPEDGLGDERVMVINREMARRWFAGRDPVGATVRMGETPFRVAAVVENTRWSSLDESLQPIVTLTMDRSVPAGTLELLVRTAGEARVMLPVIRSEMAALDPDLSIIELRTMEQQIGTLLLPVRMMAVLLGLFAALSLTLAAVGIYGVVSYTVSRSSRDIGLRMALGAGRPRVVASVVRSMVRPVALGLAMGVVGAIALSGVVQPYMFGVGPRDPLTFGVIALILVLVALLATLVPARRATAIDPVSVLRSE